MTPSVTQVAQNQIMLTRRDFLAIGAGSALFPSGLLHRDKRWEHEIVELKRVGGFESMKWAADFCRRHPPASGTGAVAGSLVAYRLGLTRIDPVKHGLYFERFLNPRRTDPLTIQIAADAGVIGRVHDPGEYAPVLLRPNVEALGLELRNGRRTDVASFLDLGDAEAGKEVLRDLRPTSVEDFAIVMALARYGPLEEGLTSRYLERRLGRTPWRVSHPALQPILGETFGLWVYQEQVIRAGERIGGLTAGEADDCRKSLGKKIPQEVNRWRELFCAGAGRRGIEGAVDIFDEMAYYSGFTALQAHCLAWAELAMRNPAWKT